MLRDNATTAFLLSKGKRYMSNKRISNIRVKLSSNRLVSLLKPQEMFQCTVILLKSTEIITSQNILLYHEAIF